MKSTNAKSGYEVIISWIHLVSSTSSLIPWRFLIACSAFVLLTACDRKAGDPKVPADVSEEDGQDSVEQVASRLMLTAATDLFQLQMEWESSSNRRSIEVAGTDVDLPRFSVDLIERPSPWTQSHAPHSFPEITMTRHGPYMPGAYLEVNDEPWQVVVAHEILDFATEKDLENFLKWKIMFFGDSFALDRAGNYVELTIASRTGTDDVNYLSISAHYLFINGEVPSEEKLNHASRGILETNYAPQFR